MSLDAGGLAQMTYNPHNNPVNSLGVPGSGFASRGKGAHIKRLSVAPPSKISTIDETRPVNTNPAPRTSRSHLLAGLRTAPKSPTHPTSAPLNPKGISKWDEFQTAPSMAAAGLGGGGGMRLSGISTFTPHTSIGMSFPNHQQLNYGVAGAKQIYSLPEQVLAPPAVQVGSELDAQIDPDLYAELVATNRFLAQQQARLQQQLIDVTAAAQQFQGMSIGNGVGQHHQYPAFPMTTSSGLYTPQLQHGLQPIVQAMPAQPGLYSVYNPITGQHGYVVDNAPRAQSDSSPTISNHDMSHSPPPPTPTFRAEVSPPPESTVSHSMLRSNSPPKSASPPSMDHPLPAPSANAFRPSHKKASSFASGFGELTSSPVEGLKATGPKSAGFPQTPMSGTFGPGQSRAGDHPMRQPRGPPSLEELIAKPTSKHEGSKNFATRQRRRAVHNLVRAGLERRGASRGSGSIDSLGSMTSTSDTDITFSISSDNDTDSLGSRSGSLSSKPSLRNLRAAAIGAIGSERKELRDRSREREKEANSGPITASSVSSEEGAIIGGKLVEIKVEEPKSAGERRKTPLLVLTNAEKRKSSIF